MRTILEWLEHTKENRSDYTCYMYNDSSITYEEVVDKSQRVGSGLLSKLETNKPVAVLMHKSIETIIAYFGIVYAGRTYAPIDVDSPIDRILTIVDIIQPEIIIVDKGLPKEMIEVIGGDRLLYIDEVIDYAIDDEKLGFARGNRIITDPLYIIFTSGSSGSPKGVVTSHQSLVTYIEAYSEVMDIRSSDIIGNQSPLDYVAAIRDIYLPIYTGCSCVLIDKEKYSKPKELFRVIEDNYVNCIGWSTASLSYLYKLHVTDNGMIPECLNKICFSGSIMRLDVLEGWKKAIPKAVFINQYGPTEATASCTYYKVDDLTFDKDVPVGKPYKNYRIYIVDEETNEVKNGDAGEILVGGPGVTLGYYGEREKTAEVFIQNPIENRFRDIVYRTGDYGYIDEEGDLHFIGRKDRQIKLMGHRVELDEVEKAASKHYGIDRCACVYNESRDRLILYYEGDSSEKDLAIEIRRKLPLYMLPRSIKRIDKIPTLPNGKIAYKELEEINND